MTVFVIVGKNGVGKTIVGNYLMDNGFKLIEIRGVLNSIPEHKNKSSVYYAERKTKVLELTMPYIINELKVSKNIIIEGILSKDEIFFLKKFISDFHIIYTHSNKTYRINRIKLRSNYKSKKEAINNVAKSDFFRSKIMGVDEVKKYANLIIKNNSNSKLELLNATEKGVKSVLIKQIINFLKSKSKNKILDKSQKKPRRPYIKK
ncbi:MAG: hypothetical protein PHX47_02000 [Candidatus ainarchaeum sp.]|jgi:dephospho-CoA kinase|nr:hypothetical protein [Candidatus ainarchaeum sp.]